ncbi:NADPH-dependent FMN reductase [Zestomonas thermotolerans]|jgi:FMN reductase|uniref:NADPH-dependent FMN reductase n=1 Tax=Zestomonas thermotolerans TaxID=157784 RepID=UPI000365224E|nr:NADPH-dependent FMN reductase [Pseudomonas thermotolerans]MBO2510278.1 NADPH-dependent FMN reductase [Gammaproteobacteria bacterium]
MLVVSLGGSPAQRSRSNLLLERSRGWLQRQGVEVVEYRVTDFPAEVLLHARFDSPHVADLRAQVANADGLLVATPVYKASFSGALKTVLDLLPERALENKVVLPLSTGGSKAHLLAVDYALRPVLSALKAEEVLQGVFADDSQIAYGENGAPARYEMALLERLEEALQQFHQALVRRPKVLDKNLLATARWSV